MSSSSTYARISDTHSIEPDNGSPQDSSQGSSTSPPNRFTPDLDTEDEEEGPYVLSRSDGVDGYEMKELGVRRKDNHADSRNTGNRSDETYDSDDEEDGTWIDRTTSRRTSVQSFELYTPDEERAVRRKLDTHLVIAVSILYLLSFLDRSNVCLNPSSHQPFWMY
jgi:hypothetical protein